MPALKEKMLFIVKMLFYLQPEFSLPNSFEITEGDMGFISGPCKAHWVQKQLWAQ